MHSKEIPGPLPINSDSAGLGWDQGFWNQSSQWLSSSWRSFTSSRMWALWWRAHIHVPLSPASGMMPPTSGLWLPLHGMNERMNDWTSHVYFGGTIDPRSHFSSSVFGHSTCYPREMEVGTGPVRRWSQAWPLPSRRWQSDERKWSLWRMTIKDRERKGW